VLVQDTLKPKEKKVIMISISGMKMHGMY
jgi:hypothetical protein